MGIVNMKLIVGSLAVISITTCLGCGKRGLDLSSPKSAAMEYGKATEEGDLNKTRGSVILTKETDKLIVSLVPFMHAMHELQKASMEKFGEKGYQVIGASSADDISKQIEKSKIDIQGDTATVTTSANNPRPLKLTKKNNEWRVDLTGILPPSSNSQQTDRVITLYNSMTLTANEVTADVKGGKFKTIEEAKLGLNTKMQETLVKIMAADRAKAQPTGLGGTQSGAPAFGNSEAPK